LISRPPVAIAPGVVSPGGSAVVVSETMVG
jgi:hypothetical protein